MLFPGIDVYVLTGDFKERDSLQQDFCARSQSKVELGSETNPEASSLLHTHARTDTGQFSSLSPYPLLA